MSLDVEPADDVGEERLGVVHQVGVVVAGRGVRGVEHVQEAHPLVGGEPGAVLQQHPPKLLCGQLVETPLQACEGTGRAPTSSASWATLLVEIVLVAVPRCNPRRTCASPSCHR